MLNTKATLFLAAVLLNCFFVGSQSQASETNEDVKILSSRSRLVTFLPVDSTERIINNPRGPGEVLNTKFCKEESSTVYGSTTELLFDCNSAYAEALGKPLLNYSSWSAEVHKYEKEGVSYYSRNGAYIYEVTALIKAAAFDSEVFTGMGLHANTVTWTEAIYNRHWGFLVGENDANGGFISKSDIEKMKRTVTLKNGEKAYAFDFILAQMSFVAGASKPSYVGLTIRPNAKYEVNGQTYVQWDNVQFDYFTGRSFDLSTVLLQ
ncbi:MAG: hypothetical protein J0L82_14910 [Deltaproteobacteria bacterium]|nr:hypothetical protein [Deltaproteobacteria bacterium]